MGEEAKHTPGPWRSYYDKGDGAYLVSTVEPVHPLRPECGQHIAVLQPYQPNAIANARLVAAAPELLALAAQFRDDMRHPPSEESRERRLAMIDAAIAKATGA